jgi:hypothetical protein
MTTKVCKKCQVEKDVGEFPKARARCFPCYREQQRARYANNSDYFKARVKKFREENLEVIKKRKKEYAENNKEKIADYHRKYYEENKERIDARITEWINNNRDRVHERRRAWREAHEDDIQYKMTCMLRKNVGRSLEYVKKGELGVTSKLELLGCSLGEFKEFLEDKFEDGMSWENHGEWHLDHIRPLSSFDLSVPEQVRESSHYTNLQPLWAIDNLRKGSKFG